jgi:hypothetical protein
MKLSSEAHLFCDQGSVKIDPGCENQRRGRRYSVRSSPTSKVLFSFHPLRPKLLIAFPKRLGIQSVTQLGTGLV